MAHLSLTLLGPPEDTLDGIPITSFQSNKVRALLAYLAVEADRPHRRDTLATLLWSNRPDRAARANLRRALSNLRKAIGDRPPSGDRDADPPLLHVSRESIQFNSASESWVDVAAFGALLGPHPPGDPATERLEEAVALYRGPFLEGFSLKDSPGFDDWCLLTQEQLHRQVLIALRRLTKLYEHQGQLAQACEMARRQVELEPWQEEAHRDLMRLLALRGLRSAALRQYQVCERVLRQELGVAPERETTALYTAIKERRVRQPPAPSDAIPDRLQRLAPPDVAEQPPSTRGETPGERRIVTILFSDVKNATSMAEHLDPEEVMEIMQGALDLLIEPIARYEGTVARLMGDALLAFFGAPVAHEDDAERACRAALEIVEGSRAYAARLEQERGLVEFSVRVAIHTGLVTVGEVGSDPRVEYTAMGDAVNVASGVEGATEPGTVLVTEDTHRLIAPLFDTEALGPIQVRGRSEPVAMYRVLAPRDAVGKGRGIAGLASPLVGREAELQALQEALQRLQVGVGGIITILGEAGIGKSRLVAELRKAIVPTNLQWVEGRCLSYGTSMAYLLWLDALRSMLHMPVEASPLALRDALHQLAQSLCPDRFEQVYPYLARLMSLPLDAEIQARLRGLDAEGLKFLTFRAVETIVECAAHDSPLVLICEDLHWADPTSVELLEHLLTLTDRVSLLVICALRPYRKHVCWGIRETAVRLYHHRHTRLWLEPLSADDSQALMRNLLRVEALPRPLRRAILVHAEGNPFYVEEVIRSLIDSEAIVQDDATGHWQAVQEVHDIAIPDTLQGVLMARIDRLEEEARRVLQLASVIGRIFVCRVLTAIARQEMELDQHLLTLQREEMIRERARVPELEYIFKHHLTQEAAYNGLLLRERRQFHRQVAEALEQLFPDRVEEQLGLLAHHWERAEERDKAVHFLRRAGEQAAAQYANAEAVAYFSRALDLTSEEDLAERYSLLMAREGVYYLQLEREAPQADLAALRELVEALGDDARRAEVALRQARCAHDRPDYPAEVAAAQKAVRLAQAAGDVRLEAAGYQQWGTGLSSQGDYSGAQSRLERALTLAREAHLRPVEAASLSSLAMDLWELGDLPGARALHEQSLGIYREIGDRRMENYERLLLGFAAKDLSDYDEARASYEEALRVFREIGDRRNEAFAHSLPGRVYHGLGDYGRARAYYEQNLQGSRQVGNLRGVAEVLCELSLLSHQEGDDEAALQCAQQALQMAHDQGERSYRGAFAICLGHSLLGLERFDEATETYRQALALLRELGQSRDAVDAVAGLARVCMAQGDLSQAQAHVEEILSYVEDHTLADDFLLEEPMRPYLTCYQMLQANDDPRAEAILEEAYRLLQERAAKISDEEERRSFLENVAANREIVRAYAERE